MRLAARFPFLMTAMIFLLGAHNSSSAMEELESQRLKNLQHAIKAGDSGALETFWQTIAQQGTPMVEPIQGNENHVELTFLWRGSEETNNVILFSALTARANMDFTAKHLAKSHLIQLAGTDVWYKSFRINHDARLSYYLSHNDSLLPAEQRKAESDWATLQPDPLNPNKYVLTHEDQDWVRSIIDLPGAKPVPWVVPQEDVPGGSVEEHHMPSSFLKNDRRFWIYTPSGYSKDNQPYNLLVLFDGWRVVHMDPTITVLDNLLAADQIEPTVAVMVGQQDRMLELGCHEPFNQFLIKELIPWIRENYHVSANPAETTVGGGSAGGLGAVCAGWRHPEVFGNVISQSGYFSWDPFEAEADADVELEFEWITRQIAASPKVNIRLVLSVGTLEHDHDFLYSPSFLQANRHMRDVLLAKGYQFTYMEVAGGHDIYSGALTFPDLLIAMTDHIRKHSSAQK